MDKWELPENDRLSTLYCHSIHGEPVYPVIEELDFTGLFQYPGSPQSRAFGFTGFSSHCLNQEQPIRAIKQGATVVEVHMKLEDTPLSIPDSRFSLLPAQVEHRM